MRYPEPQQLYPELPDPIRRGGGFIPQTRYFNFFDGVQEYVQLAQPVTLSGDYSISALVYKIPGQDVRVYGNSGGFTSRLLVNSDGSVNFRADNSGSQLGIDAPAGSIADNSLVSVEVTRAGSNGEIIVNGLSVSSGTVGTGDCVINQLARQSTSVSDGSIIANVRITDNGTLIHNWAIDDNSNVIADSVNPLGSELIVNSNWTDGSTGSGTASIDSGGVFTLTRTDAGNVGRLDQVVATTPGETYLATVENLTNSFAIRAGTTLGGAEDLDMIISSPGTVDVLFTATASTTYINVRSTTNNGTTTGRAVSVRQATGYGTLVNPSGGWGLFDKQSDGDWLGSVNLWSGPLSFAGTGWTDNNDGSYTCDGSQTANTEIRINDRVSQGLEYRCAVNVESIQSGSVQCRAGNAASAFSNTTGIISDDLIPTTADPHLRIIGDASFSGTVDGISYKQLLRSA